MQGKELQNNTINYIFYTFPTKKTKCYRLLRMQKNYFCHQTSTWPNANIYIYMCVCVCKQNSAKVTSTRKKIIANPVATYNAQKYIQFTIGLTLWTLLFILLCSGIFWYLLFLLHTLPSLKSSYIPSLCHSRHPKYKLDRYIFSLKYWATFGDFLEKSGHRRLYIGGWQEMAGCS